MQIKGGGSMTDLISRADAMRLVHSAIKAEIPFAIVADLIKGLPSADALLKQEIDFHKKVSRIEAEKVVDLEHQLADMVSLVHDGSQWENRWICDKCGHKIFEPQTNFCPNCGARMIGGEDE